ncbi:IS1182 family transposase, partial [Vreelandella rituensis]
GLSRFRRRGLAGVKREFALHALAYNLARAVALSLYHRLWDWLWRCLGLSYLATKEMIAAARV